MLSTLTILRPSLVSIMHCFSTKLKKSFNVTDGAHSWIASYLSNRRQRVVVDGKMSDWAPVLSGVPEGSVCGPLLFICFTADLPHCMQTHCVMYADDVKIFNRITCSDDTDDLQADLERLSAWSKSWLLKLNPSKCHVITFTLRNSPILAEYSLDHSILERRTETRDLGVLLDTKLTFTNHIDSVVARANRMLGLLI